MASFFDRFNQASGIVNAVQQPDVGRKISEGIDTAETYVYIQLFLQAAAAFAAVGTLVVFSKMYGKRHRIANNPKKKRKSKAVTE